MEPKKVNIPFPPDLHERLVALARREHRSLRGQVIHMLWEGLERRGIVPPEPLPERPTEPN